MNIALIRESFEAIKPHALEVIEHFYDELFTRYPQAKGLFDPTKMEKQHRALIGSLSHIVDYLDDSEHLPDYLRKMGKRHNTYGTKPEHFAWVGESLLATLEYYFESQWTPELAESWTKAFTIIATEMKAGMETQAKKIIDMKKPDPKQPLALSELAKQIAQELIKKAVAEEVASPAFQQSVRDGAKEMLRKAIETEAEEMLSEVRSNQLSA